MRVRYTGNDHQPGTMYAWGDGPRSVIWEGEIACGFHDENRCEDVFVIWDDAAGVFRKVPIDYCKPIPLYFKT